MNREQSIISADKLYKFNLASLFFAASTFDSASSNETALNFAIGAFTTGLFSLLTNAYITVSDGLTRGNHENYLKTVKGLLISSFAASAISYGIMTAEPDKDNKASESLPSNTIMVTQGADIKYPELTPAS